jgi:hypothetical protein
MAIDPRIVTISKHLLRWMRAPPRRRGRRLLSRLIPESSLSPFCQRGVRCPRVNFRDSVDSCAARCVGVGATIVCGRVVLATIRLPPAPSQWIVDGGLQKPARL